MKKLIFVLMLQWMASVSPGHQITKRMVHGALASRYQFPYIASFRTHVLPWKNHCGAALIDPHWLLTAGHCLIPKWRRAKTEYIVHLGATRIRGGDRSVYNVTKVYLHPGYWKDPSIIRNDLALLYVSTPIKYSMTVYSKPLGTVEDVDGVPLITAGWGAPFYQADHSAHYLEYIQMSTVNTKRCAAFHAKRRDLVDGKMHICAMSPGKTTCTGDSGGPLVDTRTGRLVGIFSSMQYCETDFPALFVRLSTFKDWIENVTKLHFPLK